MSGLKALILIQVACIVLIRAQPSPQPTPVDSQAFRHAGCPLNDDVSHAVQLPYPYDCNKYYSCFRGLAYLVSCPVGLHWSALTYRCDYPLSANCQPAPQPQPQAQLELQTQTFATNPYQATLEYLPYAADCSKYQQCQVLQCPPQFLWSSRLQRCDLPAFAACATAAPLSPAATPTVSPTYVPPMIQTTPISIPTAATPAPTAAPNIMPWPIKQFTNYSDAALKPLVANQIELDQLCSKAGAEYVHYPGDCHRFIQCNGVAFVQKCPANLFWNSELLTCDRFCK